jgi:hypothetical protein
MQKVTIAFAGKGMSEYYSRVFETTGVILVLVIMSVVLTELLMLIETRLSHRGATA